MTSIKFFKRINVTNFQEFFEEIAGDCQDAIGVTDLAEKLRSREALASTNLGRGLAYPHCKIEGLKEFCVSVLVNDKTIDYGPKSKGPVDLFVMVVAPINKPEAYIKLMGKISKALQNDEVLESCRQSNNLNDVIKHLGV